MKISKELKDQILEELYLPEYQDGDITVREGMDAWGVGEKAARSKLDKLAEEGKLEKLKGFLPTRRVGYLYRPVNVV